MRKPALVSKGETLKSNVMPLLTRGLLHSQVILDKIYQQIYLAFGKLVAEGNHAVAAFGNVTVDLGISFVFEIAIAQIGYYLAVVKRSPIRFRPVADRAILPKERCLVRFAVGDHNSFRLRIETSGQANQSKGQYYQ
jgi:hypothetical protein